MGGIRTTHPAARRLRKGRGCRLVPIRLLSTGVRNRPFRTARASHGPGHGHGGTGGLVGRTPTRGANFQIHTTATLGKTCWPRGRPSGSNRASCPLISARKRPGGPVSTGPVASPRPRAGVGGSGSCPMSSWCEIGKKGSASARGHGNPRRGHPARGTAGVRPGAAPRTRGGALRGAYPPAPTGPVGGL